MDDYNWELLAMEIDSAIPSKRVVHVLDRFKEQSCIPELIRVDNGPEFLNKTFQLWCQDNQLKIHYIQPRELA